MLRCALAKKQCRAHPPSACLLLLQALLSPRWDGGAVGCRHHSGSGSSSGNPLHSRQASKRVRPLRATPPKVSPQACSSFRLHGRWVGDDCNVEQLFIVRRDPCREDCCSERAGARAGPFCYTCAHRSTRHTSPSPPTKLLLTSCTAPSAAWHVHSVGMINLAWGQRHVLALGAAGGPSLYPDLLSPFPPTRALHPFPLLMPRHLATRSTVIANNK